MNFKEEIKLTFSYDIIVYLEIINRKNNQINKGIGKIIVYRVNT